MAAHHEQRIGQAVDVSEGVLADRLCVQHHTAVALVDKLCERGLVRRERCLEDKREVLVRVTESGSALLQELSRQHRLQLQSVGPQMVAALA